MQALLALIMKGSEGTTVDIPKAPAAISVKKHSLEVIEEVKCGRSADDDMFELEKLDSLV